VAVTTEVATRQGYVRSSNRNKAKQLIVKKNRKYVALDMSSWPFLSNNYAMVKKIISHSAGEKVCIFYHFADNYTPIA
jgi:hypothetical protein